MGERVKELQTNGVCAARMRGTLVHGRVSLFLVSLEWQHRLMMKQYFQLKNWSASQRREWLDKHTGAYTA